MFNQTLIDALERICRDGGEVTLTSMPGRGRPIGARIKTRRGSYFSSAADATSALGQVVARVLLNVEPDRQKHRRRRPRARLADVAASTLAPAFAAPQK